jgi:hypothetical protein
VKPRTGSIAPAPLNLQKQEIRVATYRRKERRIRMAKEMKKQEMLSLLSGKGFEKSGEGYYTYLLSGREDLLDYFSYSDWTDLIESGQIKAALLEVYPGREAVNYILFGTIPSEQDIAQANILHEDDFDGFMDWLQQG